jgi:hypothetical protein
MREWTEATSARLDQGISAARSMSPVRVAWPDFNRIFAGRANGETGINAS